MAVTIYVGSGFNVQGSGFGTAKLQRNDIMITLNPER
jgi:hypothetical protein